MGLQVRRKVLLREEIIMTCPSCHLAYHKSAVFCSSCGSKLTRKASKVYANFGKSGLTSISYKTADGITINSKGQATIPLGHGISYSTSSKKK